MKRAVIVGHTGQDGTLMNNLLQDFNYEVLGISSREVYDSSGRVNVDKIDITNYSQVEKVIRQYQPDEIYYFAAVHQSSSESRTEEDLFNKSFDVNVKGLFNCLESIKVHANKARLFYASSSHIFGYPEYKPQQEDKGYHPTCIYGITKLTAMNLCEMYQQKHGVYASVGIYYNHESSLRASKFVSKKIVSTAVRIKNGADEILTLGDLSSTVDWGYAPDYMKATHLILQLGQPDTFIVSSGKRHTVQDFVEQVFKVLDLNWKDHVKEDASLIPNAQRKDLLGDNSKLTKMTGWVPETSFENMINILVNNELNEYAC
ncbi:MAG: GDP-mannose 4,6-dehydratase [Vicingus serpentipes]|nr:GDP-mannose 4,6-dehydratase [Vicingus serpentipes]